MSAIQGTNISAMVAPFDTADTYPTHSAQYGLGGFRSVDTAAARDAIPAQRRVEGMRVRVVNDPVLANNTDWEYVAGVWILAPSGLSAAAALQSANTATTQATSATASAQTASTQAATATAQAATATAQATTATTQASNAVSSSVTAATAQVTATAQAVTATTQSISAQASAGSASFQVGLANTAAGVAAGAARLYVDDMDGLAATAEGGYYSIPSGLSDEVAIIKRKVSGAAVDTGKRTPSAGAITTINAKLAPIDGVFSNTPVTDFAVAETDSFGRLARGIKNDGTNVLPKLETTKAKIDGLTVLSSTMGPATSASVELTGLLNAETDSFGRLVLGVTTDGSLVIPKLRDGGGALVYAQIVAAKAAADAALAAAASGGASGFRQSMVAAQSTWGRWPRPFMDTPPILTLTGGNPASPAGTTLTAWNATGKFRTEGGNTSQLGGNPFLQFQTLSQLGNANGFNACNGCALETVHTGTALHLSLRGSGAAVRVLANNQYVSLVKSSTSPDGNGWQLKIDFSGVSATRTIRIEADGSFQFGGFYVLPGESITAPTGTKPKICMLGTSITEGGGAGQPQGGYASWLGRLMGCDTYNTGLGSSGVVNPGTGGRVKLRDRSQDYTSNTFVLAIDENGINDTGSSLYTSDAAIEREFGDEYRRNLDLWFAAHPTSPWIGFGPFWPNETPVANAYRVRDAKQKVLAEYPLTAFIDTLTPGNLIKGDRASATPPAADYINADNTHPTYLGAQFTGLNLFAVVNNLIRTVF